MPAGSDNGREVPPHSDSAANRSADTPKIPPRIERLIDKERAAETGGGPALSTQDRYALRQWRAAENLRQAKDKNTPPDVLDRLARSQDPVIRTSIADNESTPPAALGRLLIDKDSAVRLVAGKRLPEIESALYPGTDYGMALDLAENPSTPPDALAKLSRSPSDKTRMAAQRTVLGLVENPKTSAEILRGFADYPDREIRSKVAEHPSLPEDAVIKLASDKDLFVRAAARRSAAVRGIAVHTEERPVPTRSSNREIVKGGVVDLVTLMERERRRREKAGIPQLPETDDEEVARLRRQLEDENPSVGTGEHRGIASYRIPGEGYGASNPRTPQRVDLPSDFFEHAIRAADVGALRNFLLANGVPKPQSEMINDQFNRLNENQRSIFWEQMKVKSGGRLQLIASVFLFALSVATANAAEWQRPIPHVSFQP